MDTLHACIKDNFVVNVVIADNEDNDIIDTLKETFEYDIIIEASDPLTAVGWAYDPIIGACINPETKDEPQVFTDPGVEEPSK